jgi:hypothetical protein
VSAASIARRVLVPVAAYALLEWVFAYVTVAEGLVTPRGTPNLGVVAIGCAYVGLRLVVRLMLPGVVAFTIAEAAGRRLARARA